MNNIKSERLEKAAAWQKTANDKQIERYLEMGMKKVAVWVPENEAERFRNLAARARKKHKKELGL